MTLYYYRIFKYGLKLKKFYKSGKKYYIPFPNLGNRKKKKLLNTFLKHTISKNKNLNLKNLFNKIFISPMCHKRQIKKFK
jgi:hypothetical protein